MPAVQSGPAPRRPPARVTPARPPTPRSQRPRGRRLRLPPLTPRARQSLLAIAFAGLWLILLTTWQWAATSALVRALGSAGFVLPVACLWLALALTFWPLIPQPRPARLVLWLGAFGGLLGLGQAVAVYAGFLDLYRAAAPSLPALGVEAGTLVLGLATLALAWSYSTPRAVRLARFLTRCTDRGARLGWRAGRATSWWLRHRAPILVCQIVATTKSAVERVQSLLGRKRAPLADAAPLEDVDLAEVESAEPSSEPAKVKTPRAEKAGPAAVAVTSGRWELPPITLLDKAEETADPNATAERVTASQKTIEKTLAEFGIPVRVTETRVGPTVTQFGLEPGFHERYDRKGNLLRRERVKVREILARHHDLSLSLARTIRIEAPVPGRPVVGIEVPNTKTTVVGMRSLLESEGYRRGKDRIRLPIALGEHLAKEAVIGDLAKMPHLLIAGATGSGKSVCINTIVTSLILRHTPDTLRFLMVDPKRVELTAYNEIPHLLAPVVVDAEKAVPALHLAIHEMDTRYKLFAELGVRNLESYNRLPDRQAMPYIVFIIDELADLMMLAPDDVERSICRLAQLARATGIHLVVATQRPSVNVITGLIKANIPTRISFMVTSQVDSRTILDMAGAEKLLGQGDMLYMPTDAAKPLRLQGTYVGDDEIHRIVQYWSKQGAPHFHPEFENLPEWSAGGGEDEDDDLYDQAADLARQLAEQGKEVSINYLQRRLRVGYNRAARLKERLDEEGFDDGFSLDSSASGSL
ncbi:MAG: DNA translocase FtsK [Chloroflexi bacterium]|nr:DNA translocase FtsK [Chloroflexota bacterium]